MKFWHLELRTDMGIFSKSLPRTTDSTFRIKSTMLNALVYGHGGNGAPWISSPVFDCFGLLKRCYEGIASLVSALFFQGRPTAIAGGVTSIIVDAVDGEVILVSVAHCPCEKDPEIRVPLRANGYAASAISFVVDHVRLVAARSHLFPDRVKPKVFYPYRFVVRAAFDFAK